MKNVNRIKRITFFLTLVLLSNLDNNIEANNLQDLTGIRLKYYTASKQRDYPLPNEPVTIRVNEKNFDGLTNKKSLIDFKQVPCDKEVTVYFRGKPQAVFKRYIKCGTKVFWIYFINSFVSLEGKIEQEK